MGVKVEASLQCDRCGKVMREMDAIEVKAKKETANLMEYEVPFRVSFVANGEDLRGHYEDLCERCAARVQNLVEHLLLVKKPKAVEQKKAS